MSAETPTQSKRPADSHGNAERIADEHKALGQALVLLEKTSDPRLLLEQLTVFRRQLERHFESEEGDDGLEELVASSAPHLLSSVERIFDEHREFLAAIDGLLERLRELLSDPMASILGDVENLARRLREHEERETELVSDAIYTDLGRGL